MNRLHILLLEDSLLDAELIQEILTSGGIDYELVRVETRIEFLTALEKETFDLILSDYSLPSFDGISALKIAHTRCPEVPFIFVSATLGEELAIETLKSGATDYVLKQRLERLVPAVNRALREAEERLERKQVEAALQASEAKFRRLAESNVIGFMFWDINGSIFDANDAFLQMVGYTQEDLQTGCLRWQEMTPPEYLHLDEQAIEEMKTSGVFTSFEKEYIRKDGSRVAIFLGGALLEKSQEKGVSFVLDLTERKQMENQLRQQAEELGQANRIKDEFLAVLSHELRSPLNPILGWARLLKTRKLDEATTTRAIETIERNAKLQTQLIEDLLDISRIIQGKLSLNFCPVNLASMVEAAIETVRLTAEAKSIQIHTAISPTVGLVYGDPNRLQQVVWNLLSNAIKFTPQEGHVTIVVERNDAQAQIRVSDTGKGITADFLPHVFDYFRQADGSTTRKYGGLGLGLAIVRQLVELHGGTVYAQSPGEGRGATFTVALPLMSMQLSPNTCNVPLENSVDLQGVRVLIVDDDPDTRECLIFMLEESGATITAVPSGVEALEALSHFKPDVLVSDIGMPEMDGYTLIRKVRSLSAEQGGRILAVALTAYARDEDRTKALLAGFQQHVSKPVIPTELVTVVASLAGRLETI